MWPFDASSNQSEHDMAKALDQIADSGLKMKKKLAKPSNPPASHAGHDSDSGDKPGPYSQPQPKAMPSAKPPATGKACASAKHGSPADKTPKPIWEVKAYVTKKGVKGKIVKVGPFNAFLPEGDKEKEQACFDAINKVFRSDEAVKVADAILAK